MPHVYPSVLIDGKGPYTAQVGSVATSQAEAIAMVDKAKADGFTAIKFYGTFNPDWVAATAAEAHKLGLHVHGHIPAGMRTMDAINDGYDEITHIYFVAMQAMPDSVVKVSNGIARMQGPAKYFKDVDLNAEPMKSTIATMAAKHIVSDPTLVVVEILMVPENGDLAPEYAPLRRHLAAGGGARLPPGRADRRARLYPRRLPQELRQPRRPGGRDAQGGRADRRRDRRLGHGAGARARALRAGRLHAGGGAGGRHHRPGAQRPRRHPHRLDRGRQGRRPGAGRGRSISGTSATCAT